LYGFSDAILTCLEFATGKLSGAIAAARPVTHADGHYIQGENHRRTGGATSSGYREGTVLYSRQGN
jgi:hypothetical protein